MKKLLLFTLISAHLAVFGQFQINGTINGKTENVVEPVPFANILIKGTDIGTSTDFDGKFSLTVKKGNYILVVSAIGMKSQELPVVITDKNEEIKLELQATSTTLGDFTVVAKATGESKATTIAETKQADGVKSVIGAKDIEKSGAGDAGDATKKIVGISVVGSGNVYVRGMGDRYNSAYLNGLPIASPDPDKKVIPLDLFPTSVIKSISVNKAFLPNLEGDFSGGAIDIRTKDFPDQKIFKISLGTGFNSQSIGREMMTYSGGKFDYLGFDDGTRSIPDAINDQEAYRSTEGDAQLFSTNLNPSFKTILPNTSFSLVTGNQFNLKNEKSKLGYLVALNHSNSTKYEFGKYRIINTQEDIQIDYDVENYSTGTNSSALANLGYDIDKNNFLSYNFLYVNLSNDETSQINGSHWDYSRNVYSRRFTFQRNSLMNNQISGSHFLLKDNKLRVNWSTSLNNANSTEPDRRQLVYFYDDIDDTKNYTNNATDRIENHRFFSFLSERQIAAKVEAKYIFKYNTENVEDGAKIALTFGGSTKRKTRDFDYKQYVYDLNLNTSSVDVFNPDFYINKNSHDAGLFTIQEALNPASAYVATQNINAIYSFLDYNITNKIEIIAGARVEVSEQIILYKDQTQPDFDRKEILASTDILPSFILKYQPNDTNIVRMSLSKTISRPGFREVAPFQYTEVFAGATTVGNPNLKNGENYNVDLRYERYPRLGELMAVGVFYKRLINPIVSTMEVATNQLQSFTNAKEASVAGVEFEFTKSLAFLAKNDSSIWKSISAGFNASYIYSNVKFDPSSNLSQTNSERALQGASPYLINVDVSYSKLHKEDFRTTLSLSYNVFGRRINNVGVYGLGDVYELPVNSLNLIAKVELKHFTYGLKVKNLLNQDIRFEQETNNEPIIINSTRRGVFTSFSVGYKF